MLCLFTVFIWRMSVLLPVDVYWRLPVSSIGNFSFLIIDELQAELSFIKLFYPELFYSLTLLAAVLTSLWCKTAQEVMSLHCDDLSTDESLFKVTSVCYSSLQVLLETSPHQFPVVFPVCSATDWNRKQYFSVSCRKHEGLKTNASIWGEFVRKRLKSGFM